MTAQNLVNTPDNRLVVAVDGPSGVGKSTLCRAVAKHFGAQYFDTGAPCTVPPHLRCCGPA